MRHFDRDGGQGGGKRHPVRSLWLAKMRHGHGHGAGGLFSRRGGGGFGGGGDDFSRGRKFSSDDLQVLLVALLVDEPRHGYELIRLLETRSNGFYTPSPGMVYPALTYLEEIGHTTVTAEGNRKRYAITDEGRAFLAANRERIEFILAKLNFFAQKMGMVRRALAGEDADDADDAQAGGQPLQSLVDARHKLKHLVMARSHASSAEQLRIAQILERAAAEIAATAEPDPGKGDGNDR